MTNHQITEQLLSRGWQTSTDPVTGFKNNTLTQNERVDVLTDGFVCFCGSYRNFNVKLRLFQKQVEDPRGTLNH